MSDGRTTRAEAVREQRRAEILDAALQVFAEKGYHGTAVSDVVKAAGVARGTFYSYFDSKDAIFLELLDGLLQTLRDSVSGVKRGPEAADTEAQLRQIVAGVLKTAKNNRPLTRIIFREAVGLDATVDDRLNKFYGELGMYLGAALTLGAQVGMTRSVVDTEVAATCILGSLRSVVQRYIVESDADLDVEALAAAVVDFNLRGLMPAS